VRIGVTVLSTVLLLHWPAAALGQRYHSLTAGVFVTVISHANKVGLSAPSKFVAGSVSYFTGQNWSVEVNLGYDGHVTLRDTVTSHTNVSHLRFSAQMVHIAPVGSRLALVGGLGVSFDNFGRARPEQPDTWGPLGTVGGEWVFSRKSFGRRVFVRVDGSLYVALLKGFHWTDPDRRYGSWSLRGGINFLLFNGR
jgi:hypothetical protein